jgi:hypothetical protein
MARASAWSAGDTFATGVASGAAVADVVAAGSTVADWPAGDHLLSSVDAFAGADAIGPLCSVVLASGAEWRLRVEWNWSTEKASLCTNSESARENAVDKRPHFMMWCVSTAEHKVHDRTGAHNSRTHEWPLCRFNLLRPSRLCGWF